MELNGLLPLMVPAVQFIPQAGRSQPVGVDGPALCRMFFWNEVDLDRKLKQFKSYCNAHCVHQSLNGATPDEKGGGPTPLPVDIKHYGWQSHCKGLFKLPVAT